MEELEAFLGYQVEDTVVWAVSDLEEETAGLLEGVSDLSFEHLLSSYGIILSCLLFQRFRVFEKQLIDYLKQ